MCGGGGNWESQGVWCRREEDKEIGEKDDALVESWEEKDGDDEQFKVIETRKWEIWEEIWEEKPKNDCSSQQWRQMKAEGPTEEPFPHL